MILEAAVEEAAKRLWYSDNELIEVERPDWDDALTLPVWRGIMDDTREAAKDILEAAAPHMLAGAWDSAVAEGESGGWIHDYAADDLRKRNPYRPTP